MNLTLPGSNPLTAVVDEHGVWHILIFLGLATILCSWIFEATKQKILEMEEGLLYAYILVYALALFEFPHVFFGVYNTAFQVTAAQTFAEVFLIPLGAVFLSSWASKALIPVILFQLICVWFGYPGLLNAPSFNLAFCALAVPFCPLPLSLMILITILTHHGSTAILILMAQILSILFTQMRPRFKYALIGALPGLVMVAYLNSGKLFDGGERLAHYAEWMGLWGGDWKNVLIGVGPGTFMWTSLLHDKFQGDLFLQLHSDWLQILWELGLVGFILAVLVFIRAVRNVWDNPKLLASLFGCAAFGLSYHPLRHFPSAFLTAIIFLSCKKATYLAHPSSQSSLMPEQIREFHNQPVEGKTN